ncbi:MAG: hypothetical protein IAF38_15755 [Bacteroidia bacterium]|nr:hypothetical protein [Bacteroidia bacterium]
MEISMRQKQSVNQKLSFIDSSINVSESRLKLFEKKIMDLRKRDILARKSESAVVEEAEKFNKVIRDFEIEEKTHNLLLEKKIEFSISAAGFVSPVIVLEKPVYVQNNF